MEAFWAPCTWWSYGHHASVRLDTCQLYSWILPLLVSRKDCHPDVTIRGHDSHASIGNRRNEEMECEDFLEPKQDQEYDDDL